MKSWKRLTATLAVLAAFGTLAVGSKKKDDVKITKGGGDDEDEKDSKSKDKDEKKVGKIGDKVEFDDSAWVVEEVKDLGKDMKGMNDFVKPKKTEGRFIKVKFKVTNKGKKEVSLIQDPKIVDGKDREFGNLDDQTMYLPDDQKSILLDKLQPDMTKSFYALYELPADAKSLKLQLHELELFGDDKALVDLGI